MLTQDTVLESLETHHIEKADIEHWEKRLNLRIPKDDYGNKSYNPLHVNLFKSIKKHLSRGKTLDDIEQMIVLPKKKKSAASSPQKVRVAPQQEQKEIETTLSQTQEVERLIQQQSPRSDLSSRLASTLNRTEEDSSSQSPEPHDLTKIKRSLKRFSTGPAPISKKSFQNQPGDQAAFLVLIDKLVNEKDQLHAELIETEKLNTHLKQVNHLFQNQIKEQEQDIEKLQELLKSRENFKLIDDKSRLQKELISAEDRNAQSEKEISKLTDEMKQLRLNLESKTNPNIFVGTWLEESHLEDIAFDNFGINIDSQRNRMFKITQPPERFFGHTAIIETTYNYQTNSLWKRTETLIANITHTNRLEGELLIEYILDGTPVAKASYKVVCYRNGVKKA